MPQDAGVVNFGLRQLHPTGRTSGAAIMICTRPMISLKPITPEMALMFKDVRLRALKDKPLAFSSTYAKESQFPDEEWVRRSHRWNGEEAILYLAFDGADGKAACGIAGCYAEDEGGVRRGHVISMWVDPQYRRAGVGSLLIDGLKTWAREHGMRELKLLVTSVNQAAIDFYERIGFEKSGEIKPYPNNAALFEYEMLLGLDG